MVDTCCAFPKDFRCKDHTNEFTALYLTPHCSIMYGNFASIRQHGHKQIAESSQNLLVRNEQLEAEN